MAMFPEMDGSSPFSGFESQVVVSTKTFQTSWNCICLIPSKVLTLDDEAEPSPFGTSQTGMPVIYLPAAQYAAFITGYKRLESNTGVLMFVAACNTCNVSSFLLFSLSIASQATFLTRYRCLSTFDRRRCKLDSPEAHAVRRDGAARVCPLSGFDGIGP